jgi:Amt family ammonium transporter
LSPPDVRSWLPKNAVYALAAGVPAPASRRPARAPGLALLGKQLIGVVATIVFSFTVSFVILKVLDATMGIRVDAEVEASGLDIAEHSETGYEFQ